MMKIGIAGVGGIGSNVALNLIRTNVKKFKIVDFDLLEESNLNRQFYFRDQIGRIKVEALEENLKRIEPDLEIEREAKRLTYENIYETFKDCDIIVEGFDVKECKADLLNALADSGKIVISASGVAHYDLDNVKIKKVSENMYIVGDFVKDIVEYKTFSSKVTYVAAIMSKLVLELGGFLDA